MASRAVIFVFIVYLSAWPSTIGSCPDGAYGYQCGYRCNCDQDKCNSTSGCSPSACRPGWSGPTCQTHNVARTKVTSSSGDVLPSSRATDGSTYARSYGFCIETYASNPNWWRVDLNDTVLIREVTIYFRTDYTPRRNGIQVYVTNFTDAPSGDNCYNVTGRSDGLDIADVTRAPCSGMGRYILLYTTVTNAGDSLPELDFCEVEVDVCCPGTFGSDCDNYCHCDGDVCNYVSGICPSGMCMPGWLGNSCNITCPTGDYGRRCSKRCTYRLCKDNTSSCNHATGECSGGCLAGYRTPDCTQVCSPGTFGADCCNYCHCDGDVCNYVDGVCPGGVCMSGWHGRSCNITCPTGDYGRRCSKRCTDRLCKDNTSSCNHATGECSGGCLAGYQKPDCTQECVDTFGENCTRSCSARHCRDTPQSVCDHVTGWCKGGCSPGWKDVDCRTGCVQDVEYGAGCTGNCSARMCEGGSGTCPRDTGLCSDGCQSGWTGEDCTQSDVSSLSPVTSISPAVAGIIGSLTMLVVLVVVEGMVCLWRKGDFRCVNRMNKETPRQNSSTPETSPAPPVELPTYDVLPDQDYTKLDRIHTDYETLQPTVDYQNSDVRI